MPLWTIIYFWAYWPLAVTAMVVAFRWGDVAAKAAAAALLCASIVQMAVQSRPAFVFSHVEPGILLVDSCYLIALVIFAIRTEKRWLYLASAIQLLGVTGHLARLLDPAMSRLAYAVMTGSGYAELLLIFGAVIANRAATRRI